MSQSGQSSLSGIAPGYNPTSTVSIVDDFLTSNNVGLYNWSAIRIATSDSTANNPGQVVFLTAATASSAIFLNNSFFLSSGALDFTFVFNPATLSTGINRYTLTFGLTNLNDDPTTPVFNNSVYFSYTDNANSGNWIINSVNGGVSTSINTSTAATTGFKTFRMVSDSTASNLKFYINGVQVGSTITTNIPTGVLGAFVAIRNIAGTIPNLFLDLFSLNQTLNTSR